ncbi:hypothetical protein EYF80_062615 [Liparis tanakae]|uniref:Uncharacterized protein n=1 Tax=Liparis tanakae TaxID=230148 RepID=A0A4Z2EG01_9TELE|nr:hypothetical protein EYF80_062615 [Liparis tanakae]
MGMFIKPGCWRETAETGELRHGSAVCTPPSFGQGNAMILREEGEEEEEEEEEEGGGRQREQRRVSPRGPRTSWLSDRPPHPPPPKPRLPLLPDCPFMSGTSSRLKGRGPVFALQ